jgi:thiol-disulfide isomerase/thioredoxin
MRLPRRAVALVLLVALALAELVPPTALGGPGPSGRSEAQGAAPAAPPGAEDTVRKINEDYDRQLLQLDRQRLERLGRLAARQKPAEAAATYEQMFRLGIAANLFRENEAAADAVVRDGSSSPTTTALAHLVRVIARADRGAFEESLDCLRETLARRGRDLPAGAPRASLAPGELVGICDAYYQRLVHEGRYETARKAFQMAIEGSGQPAVVDFLKNRLRRIDLVGKPAPPIRGTDLDGQPFDLADSRGKVVLVVFWASWCLPCAAETSWLSEAYDAYRGRGFQVVGVDLDASPDGGAKSEAVLPNVRRFLIDHNVRWPVLVNGEGDRDYAKAYGVSDIPANVLVDRGGNVVEVDLVRKNLEPVLSRVVGR